MKIDNEIIEVISDNLIKKSEFEFIGRLEDITLSDIDEIEKLSTMQNFKYKFSYQIIDNAYIKIQYLHK